MTDFNTSIPSFTVERAKASELQTLADLGTALTDGWTDWSSSFSISGTTTGVTKGSSTYEAKYKRVGKDLKFRFWVAITTGGAWNAGSGTWLFNLPFAVAASRRFVGRAFVFDNGTAGYPSVLIASSDLGTSSQCHLYHNTSGTPLGSGGPGTAWATGDFIIGQLDDLELA